MSELTAFIERHTAKLAPLENAAALAEWEAATRGTEEANRRAAETQAQIMRLYADQKDYEHVDGWVRSGAAQDPHEARQLKILHLAYRGGQQDEETIRLITAMSQQVHGIFANFRPRYSSRQVSDNELEQVLKRETDSEKLREAWEASKAVGAQVADTVRELARTRNAAARRKGFASFYKEALELSELDESVVFGIFDELERLTREPYRRAKQELDAQLSERFRIPARELRPWHYFDRFFQNWPELGATSLDDFFADKDPVDLALRTYDGLGLEVRDILERSDLYERAGKNQHAFCIDIDRHGDIRTLNNLKNTLRWNGTLLHELGHGVDFKYIDRSLPYLLRTVPHALSTEAIALLMGRLNLEEAWLTDIARLPEGVLSERLPKLSAQRRNTQILFARWVFVMSYFERALYSDPDQDLNSLWWDLVERFQFLTRPEGRDEPDWAAKYHIANAPAMYYSYLLGELEASQLMYSLNQECGRLVGCSDAGRWLVDRVFSKGAEADWNDSLKIATGQSLTPKFFVDQFVK